MIKVLFVSNFPRFFRVINIVRDSIFMILRYGSLHKFSSRFDIVKRRYLR